MTPQTLTKLFVITVVLAITLFDLQQYEKSGYSSTISSFLSDLSDRWPPFKYLLAVALIFLWGHVVERWGVLPNEWSEIP